MGTIPNVHLWELVGPEFFSLEALAPPGRLTAALRDTYKVLDQRATSHDEQRVWMGMVRCLICAFFWKVKQNNHKTKVVPARFSRMIIHCHLFLVSRVIEETQTSRLQETKVLLHIASIDFVLRW